MPIETAIDIPNVSREVFEEVDALVMKCAFASQNALGRLCDERVYENDIAARLRAIGMVEVYTQVAVRACHGEFAKEYRLDLVVNGVVYELKTAAAFSLRHDAQVYHYAMMLGIHYLKLLNLRPRSVEGLLRYNAVMPGDRQAAQWDTTEWNPVSSACENLFTKFLNLIADWGTHLDSHLYQEALIHFSGGETRCRCRVPVTRNDIVLGSHEILTHQPGHSFTVTALSDPEAYRPHLTRLLRITGQQTFQWFNINKSNLALRTLRNV